jgi:hypothetical protein
MYTTSSYSTYWYLHHPIGTSHRHNQALAPYNPINFQSTATAAQGFRNTVIGHLYQISVLIYIGGSGLEARKQRTK